MGTAALLWAVACWRVSRPKRCLPTSTAASRWMPVSASRPTTALAWSDIRQILDHIGVESEPPHICPARGPPMRDDCDAQTGEGVAVEPDWDLAAQPAPRLRGRSAHQLVTGRGGDSTALRAAAAFVAGPQPIREQRLHHSRAATAQTAGIRGVGMPQARAILGLMRLNFLSVEDLRLQFEAMGQPTPEEKGVARAVLEGLLLTRAAHRFNTTAPSA